MDKEEVADKLLKQYNVLSSFYEFHLEIFAGLSESDMQLLTTTFYIGREMSEDDMHSIDVHLENKYEEDPFLPQKLNPILKTLADELQLTDEMKKDLLFDI